MSPRPNPPRTIGAEDRMRANVLRILEDDERTIPWLARKMADAGCPIGPASLWKALRRDRAIYVDEALAISAALGAPISDLVGDGRL